MRKLNFVVWGRGYRWRYFYKNIYDIIKYSPHTIKYIFQRIFYGYAECDVWSIDYHLSNIIPNMIRDLRHHHHGHPMDLKDEKWNEILIEIENAFRLDQVIDDLRVWSYYKKHFGKDVAFEKQEFFRKKRDEGFQLFIKYYNNLWD